MKSIAEELRAGTIMQGAELTEADVGKPFGLLFQMEARPGGAYVTQHDVGCRVWWTYYGPRIERPEDRDARKGWDRAS